MGYRVMRVVVALTVVAVLLVQVASVEDDLISALDDQHDSPLVEGMDMGEQQNAAPAKKAPAPAPAPAPKKAAASDAKAGKVAKQVEEKANKEAEALKKTTAEKIAALKQKAAKKTKKL